MKYRLVSPDEAKQIPYPYVYVTEEGAVHELSDEDKAYLEEEIEEEIDADDLVRVYMKASFAEPNAQGQMCGFCRRSEIPSSITVQPTAAAEPIEYHGHGVSVANGMLTAGGVSIELSRIRLVESQPPSRLSRFWDLVIRRSSGAPDRWRIYVRLDGYGGRRRCIARGLPMAEAERLNEALMFAKR